MSEEIKESPTGELEQGEFKIKKKRGRPKKLTAKDEPTKLDLSKKEEETKTEDNAIQESRAESGVLRDEQPTVGLQEVGSGVSESVTEEKVQEPDVKQEEEVTVIQEITNEEEPEVKEVIEEPVASPQVELPENVEKLVDFMKDTGGTVEDYVRLNADYSNIDEEALLREYYKQAKPHLDHEEISFLLEDNFAYNPEEDEDRSIRKKKLAYKEEIAKARGFLESLKSKYYEEIKLRPGVTQEQKKAMDFFNRYNEDQKMRTASHERFVSETNNLLNEEFKGFDFKLGDKKFRYGIKDPSTVADNQSDISNFIKTFLNDKGEIEDTRGYHKALYAAQNADTIANHFYEQGKTDAIKDTMAKSKNINLEPRKTASGEIFVGGLKVKAISGLDSSKLKIKKKTFN